MVSFLVLRGEVLRLVFLKNFRFSRILTAFLLRFFLRVKGAVSREVFYVFCVNCARIIKVHSMINKKPLNDKKA